jgi:hypothetical protein
MYNLLSGTLIHMLVQQMPGSFVVYQINMVDEQASYYLKSKTAEVANQRLGNPLQLFFLTQRLVIRRMKQK